MPDEPATTPLFDAVAAAVAPYPPAEAEACLAYMLASLMRQERPGQEADQVKLQGHNLLGQAMGAVWGRENYSNTTEYEITDDSIFNLYCDAMR